MITTLQGNLASPLGLATHPEQDLRCARRALDRGINYFFFYSPGAGPLVNAIARFARTRRDELIIASGSGARKHNSLLAARKKILTAAGSEIIDVFFSEYINPSDDPAAIFGDGGVLDELQRWKADGWIRFVGASAHDRKLALQLVEDPRVDVLMHRFNMAHRKAARDVFPAALRSRTPVVAFTATRWATLLEPPTEWPAAPASAADCYRYCLAQPAVTLVLTAPKTTRELDQNLEVLASPRMNARDQRGWERYGDLIHGRGIDAFESQWP